MLLPRFLPPEIVCQVGGRKGEMGKEQDVSHLPPPAQQLQGEGKNSGERGKGQGVGKWGPGMFCTQSEMPRWIRSWTWTCNLDLPLVSLLTWAN